MFLSKFANSEICLLSGKSFSKASSRIKKDPCIVPQVTEEALLTRFEHIKSESKHFNETPNEYASSDGPSVFAVWEHNVNVVSAEKLLRKDSKNS